MFGSVSDYGTDDEATTVVTDLTCPADRFYEFNLLNCNLTDAKSSNGCLSYEFQPVITCYDGKKRLVYIGRSCLLCCNINFCILQIKYSQLI